MVVAALGILGFWVLWFVDLVWMRFVGVRRDFLDFATFRKFSLARCISGFGWF